MPATTTENNVPKAKTAKSSTQKEKTAPQKAKTEKELAQESVDASDEGISLAECVGVLNAVPTPIMAIDTDYNITHINNAGADVIGESADKLIGRKCYKLFNTPHCNTDQCRCRQAMEQDLSATGETVTMQNGEEIPIRYTGAPLKDDDGNIVGAVEYILDISDEVGITRELERLVGTSVNGQLDERGDAEMFEGNYRAIIEGVNSMLDALIAPLNVTAEYVDRISKGDIPEKISDEYRGDFNEIKNNLNQCIDAVNALVADANMLTQAAVEGKLDTRVDASKHSGDYAKIVQGVNDTLDAVIGPLNVTAEYVDRISKGDIPEKISDEYRGDFNKIKNNLNQVIDTMNALIEDTSMMTQAAAEGRLDARADVSKHQGAFATLVQGINNTMDYVVGPLNEAAVVLADAAEGKLTSRVEGDYKGQLAELKDNINTMIEALDSAIQEIAAVLGKAAEGDMTGKVEGDYKGQLIELKNSINVVLESMNGALGQVNEAAEQVSSASTQISTGSQSLAEAASQQASSLEEISSSLEELASMSKQNADNANQAKNLAQEARSSAETGNKSMQQMSEAIDKIKASSDQTAKIIKTIDEIAFQTNLLALNAAVEAARAGEAGKGFAVVAEEVRNLAQRSKEAAANTSDMIQESVQNADGGVRIVEDVAKVFEEINQGIGKVNDLVAEIAAASGEQSQGVDQINTAVAEMDKVTQQNAANSEESASAAEELNAQVAELQNMLTRFTLSGNGKAGDRAVQRTFTADRVARTLSGTSSQGEGASASTAQLAETPKAVKQIPLDDEEFKEF